MFSVFQGHYIAYTRPNYVGAMHLAAMRSSHRQCEIIAVMRCRTAAGRERLYYRISLVSSITHTARS